MRRTAACACAQGCGGARPAGAHGKQDVVQVALRGARMAVVEACGYGAGRGPTRHGCPRTSTKSAARGQRQHVRKSDRSILNNIHMNNIHMSFKFTGGRNHTRSQHMFRHSRQGGIFCQASRQCHARLADYRGVGGAGTRRRACGVSSAQHPDSTCPLEALLSAA